MTHHATSAQRIGFIALLAMVLVLGSVILWRDATAPHEAHALQPESTSEAGERGKRELVSPQSGQGLSETAANVSLAQNSGRTAQIWNETNGRSALNLIMRSEEPEHYHEFLFSLKAACKKALRTQETGAPVSSTSAANLTAHDQFARQFCTDPGLIPDIELALKNFDLEKIGRLSQQLTPVLDAAFESRAAALAVVDEIFHTDSPVTAANVARLLSNVATTNGTVPEWAALLPAHISAQDRAEAFSLAGEMLACQRIPTSCAPNMPLVISNCSEYCRPGESLIDYRRRSTVPLLFESAERIAIELERHRTK